MIRGIPQLAAAAIALVAPTLAPANCFPTKSFSQVGLQTTDYVLFPENAEATTSSVIGRFWQPGLRSSTNEGSCDETRWLTRCYDCPVPNHGPVYYVDGILGQMPCFAGCPASEMIVLLQDKIPYDGGIFAVGRVSELPGGVPRFDYSRVEKNWGLVPIPRPEVNDSDVVDETTLQLAMNFADPVFGYFTTDEGFPTETITAIRVLTYVGITPPVERTAWTPVARFVYEGGITTGSASIFDACPGNNHFIRFVASALELDNGQFLTDYVSAAVPVSCTAETPAGAGNVPESGTDAMKVARTKDTGELILSWTGACTPSGAFYEVYEGTLGDWTGSVPITCAVNDLTYRFPEPLGDVYYLVVPYANRVRPPIVEGSYGRLRDGTERPPSVNACRPQLIVPCP